MHPPSFWLYWPEESKAKMTCHSCGCPSIRAKALSRTNFSLGVFSTVWFAREVEDQGSGNLTLNHFPVELVPPTIDSATTSAMILLCEHPAPCGMRERPISFNGGWPTFTFFVKVGTERSGGGNFLDYTVLLGAFFVNPKKANHFPDMSDFDIVELWQGWIDLPIKGDHPAVICEAHSRTRSTLLQHAQNVGVWRGGRHLARRHWAGHRCQLHCHWT